MKKGTVLSGSAAEISTKKRQFSRTAVGFPIRFDLNAHSQGISEVFPSWVGARHACTYVYAHGIDDYQSEELPYLCLQSPCVLPSIRLYTPCEPQFLSYLAASFVLSLSSLSAQVVRGCWLAFAEESQSSSHRPPLFLLACSLSCASLLTVFISWFAPGSLKVHLGMTCSRPILMPNSFNARSGLVPGSLVV